MIFLFQYQKILIKKKMNKICRNRSFDGSLERKKTNEESLNVEQILLSFNHIPDFEMLKNT